MTSLWRPLDAEVIRDPYPMYEEIRAHSPAYQTQTGEWIITGYENVKAILKHPDVSVGNRLDWVKRGIQHLKRHDLDFQVIADAMSTFLLFINPPRHAHLRKFIHHVWNDQEVESAIRASIDSVIRDLPREFDLVKDFAHHVPPRAMASILGIDEKSYSTLFAQAQQLSKALDLYIRVANLVTIHEGARSLVEHFKQIVRNGAYTDTGLIYKLVTASAALPEPLNEDELVSLIIFLFSAGEETSVSLIGTGSYHLLRQADRQIANEQWPTVIDELLRFDSPVQLLGRLADQELTLEGVCIPKGATLTLCLGAANRDPKVFSKPSALNLSRDPNRHMAFGAGIHFCMGDWLGRLQGRLSISSLLQHFPELELNGEPVWTKSIAIRSLASLPVRVKSGHL